MFGSPILEVAIGVIFVYLLLSLIVTAANELIASLWKWRAKNLEQGIQNLLNDANTNNLADEFYRHPLIRGLCDQGKRPSYIPSRTFALALLDIVANNKNAKALTLADIEKAIAGNSQINQNVKNTLLVLTHSAANDFRQAVSEFGKLQENIEIWFNNSMDRVAGWYKRKTQLLLFLLSIFFAVALNIDTIQIVKTLAGNDVLRAAVVEQAKKIASSEVKPSLPPGAPAGSLPGGMIIYPDDQFRQNPQRTPNIPANLRLAQASPSELQQTDQDIIKQTEKAKENLVKRITDLQTTGVPVGWEAEKIPSPRENLTWWLLKILGLAFTAIAASLGAPFWFDVLNKFITVRSTGKAPEEAPKAPKEVPTPLEPGQLPGLADALRNALLVVPGAAAQGVQPPAPQPTPPPQPAPEPA